MLYKFANLVAHVYSTKFSVTQDADKRCLYIVC